MENKTKEATGKGAHHIFIAKIFFTVSGVVLNFIGLPFAFGDHRQLLLEYKLVLSVISVVNMILITGTIQSVSRYIAAGTYGERRLLKEVYKLQFILCTAVSIVFHIVLPYALPDNYQNILTPLRIASIIPFAYGFYAINVGILNGKKRFGWQSFFDIAFAALRVTLLIAGSYLAIRFIAELPTGNPINAPYSAWALLAVSFAVFSLIVVLKLPATDGAGSNAFDTKDFIRYAVGIILFNFGYYLLVNLDLLSLSWLLKPGQIPETMAGFVSPFTLEFEAVLRSAGFGRDGLRELVTNYHSGNDISLQLKSVPEALPMLKSGTALTADFATRVEKSYLGIYSMALMVGQLNLIFVTGLGLVLFPILAKESKADENDSGSNPGVFRGAFRFNTIVMVWIAAGVNVAGFSLLKLLPGNYHVSDAPVFIDYLSWSQFALSFLYFMLLPFLARGNSIRGGFFSVGVALLAFFAGWFFIGRIGAPGMSLGGIVAFGLALAGAAYFLKTNYGWSFGFIRLPVIAAWGIGCVFIVEFITGTGIDGTWPELFKLVFRAAVLTILYYIGLLISRQITKNDLISLLGFLGLYSTPPPKESPEQ